VKLALPLRHYHSHGWSGLARQGTNCFYSVEGSISLFAVFAQAVWEMVQSGKAGHIAKFGDVGDQGASLRCTCSAIRYKPE
jgi:hypothetical protein